MKLKNFFIFFFMAIVSNMTFASTLSLIEKNTIFEKLNQIPKTRQVIWNLLFLDNQKEKLDLKFQNELESILKIALLETDTQIVKLTPQLRSELKLDEKIAAFHKQGAMAFNIIPTRSGFIKEDKKNDTVRKLKNPKYFTHAHNLFVADEEISSEVNTVILLFHELSHVAFDEMVSRYPLNLTMNLDKLMGKKVATQLMKTKKGKLNIEADVYDLFSERYAFELEFRIDRNFAKIEDTWPTFYRFNGVSEEESIELIDGFVRRIYNIDHPALSDIRAYALDQLVVKIK